MEIDGDNEMFIALIEEYKIILDKSQNQAIKEAKQVAIRELIVKWTSVSGKTLTAKSFLKKLSNLKVRAKAAEHKNQPLCNWQTRLLSITKDTDDDEQLPPSEPAGTVQENISGSDMENPSSAAETIHLEANSIVDRYETSETRPLSNNQLKRVILLEQLKILQLKRMKLEKGSKTVAAGQESGNKVEIEYIGFDDMTNVPNA